MQTRMKLKNKFKLIQRSYNPCINPVNLHLQINIKMKSNHNLKTAWKEINTE